MNPKKIYISGKISGLPIDEVRLKFAASEKYLLSLGHEPVNPFVIHEACNLTWKEFILKDIALLFECDGILLQKDWTDSNGARIEHKIAQVLGMEIILDADYPKNDFEMGYFQTKK